MRQPKPDIGLQYMKSQSSHCGNELNAPVEHAAMPASVHELTNSVRLFEINLLRSSKFR